MDTPPTTETNGTPAPAAPKKKTLFETILMSTPVLLTVVATFMVGQSSSEMTRAMYFRAVAGQNQSKVGDQWGFFQAKRIRGTTYEVNAENLMVNEEPVPITKEGLVESADQLASLVGSKKEGKKVALAVEAFKDRLNKGFVTDKKKGFDADKVNKAFNVMNEFVGVKLPAPYSDKKPAEATVAEDKRDEQQIILDDVKKAVKERKTEKEIGPIVLKLSDDALHEAIVKSEINAEKTASQSKNAENVLEQIDLMIDNLAQAVYAYLASNADTSSTNEGNGKVRAQIHRLMTSYKYTRHVFTHRRYEKDARANQESAFLYEVRVFLASAKSDRHMERSKNFMYAMLVAQVAVIIASLAMAVKQRSLVWSLATLAGLVAITYGASVFLGLNLQ